jgi:coproporphyrinogen III oxidase
MPSKEQIVAYLQGLQDQICSALETTDGGTTFSEDLWQREGGGGGRSRTIRNGNIIEKGGVGFSEVHGQTHEALLKQLKLTEPADFFATGVSIVIHPRNPMVPIIHMNVRYFEMSNGIFWFGGGIDLTPHYVVEDDARWFHQQLKNVCNQHGADYYAKHKEWADNYFFIPHRNETRGVGGIFYDYLGKDGLNKDAHFAYMQGVGNAFAPIYTHFMKKNHSLPFTETNKNWQKLRRGRYVEFNLVWDRGTKFGLETNGRTESILMSLPPEANWEYNFVPEPNSREAQTLSLLKKGIDWVV